MGDHVPSGGRRSDPNHLRAAKAFQEILVEAGAGAIPADLIVSKAQQFLRGLPIEDEFQAFALWSERCVLIHKLDQTRCPWHRGTPIRCQTFSCP